MSTTPAVVAFSRYVSHDRAQTGARYKRFLNGARSAAPTVQESTQILNAIAKERSDCGDLLILVSSLIMSIERLPRSLIVRSQ